MIKINYMKDIKTGREWTPADEGTGIYDMTKTYIYFGKCFHMIKKPFGCDWTSYDETIIGGARWIVSKYRGKDNFKARKYFIINVYD